MRIEHIRDRKRDGIKGAFGVARVNENAKKVCNTFFDHTSIHNYTRVGEGRDSVEAKSMTVGEDNKIRYMMDDKSVR